MINFKKYALAAAIVLPSVFTIGANKADASKITIDKNLANGVNVRTEAHEGDNIIGLINDENKTYEILEDKGNWLKIDFEGKDAFVGKRWFHILEDTKVVYNSNFREEASLDSEVIEVIKAGTEVEVLELADNGFVKVKVGDKEGYIYHNLLESFIEAKKEKQAEAQASKQAKAQPVAKQQAPAKQSAPAQTQTQTTTTYQQQAPAQPQQAPAQQSYQGSSNWAKEWIAQRESNGSYTAYNPNGGYYGRYQLNPSLVSYGASPAQQEAAADAYVAQRYGSWENAQAFWANNGWY